MDSDLPMLPREKLLNDGVASLTDSELLALFLRTGIPGKNVFVLSHELLNHFWLASWFADRRTGGIQGC